MLFYNSPAESGRGADKSGRCIDMGLGNPAYFCLLYCYWMSTQNVIILVIVGLTVFVWIPAIILSILHILREDRRLSRPRRKSPTEESEKTK